MMIFWNEKLVPIDMPQFFKDFWKVRYESMENIIEVVAKYVLKHSSTEVVTKHFLKHSSTEVVTKYVLKHSSARWLTLKYVAL